MRHEQRRHRINGASVARPLRSAPRITSGPPMRMRDDGQHTNSNRDKPPSASTNFADDCCVACHERHGCKGRAAKVNFVTQRGPNFGARLRPKKRQQSVNPNSWGSHFPALFWGRKMAPKTGPLFRHCQGPEATCFARDKRAAEASTMGCKDKIQACSA